MASEATIDAKEETLLGGGGLKLFARSWRPAAQARAAIVLVHGFKAHGGLFDWPARELARKGIAAYAVDLRGHGRSEGERLYLETFSDYLDDLDAVVDAVRAREPGLPLFMLGHSAGGVIASSYVLEHQDQLAGFICESFAQEVPAPDVVLKAVKGISRVAPRAGVFALKDELFSRDRSFVDRMKNDPLISRARYPAQTIAELARAEERLQKAFPLVTLPLLILHGTLDRVTKPHGSQVFFEAAASPDKTLRLYEGHYHDLLNDLGRERVLAEIVEWIDAHAAGGPPGRNEAVRQAR